MTKTTNLILVIALILIAGAIFYLEKPQTTRLETGETVELGAMEDGATEAKPKVGFTAPDFVLVDYEGNVKKLSHYRGKKVLLNFWASWCPFCVEEMPLFQEFYDEFKSDGFEIIAINRGEDLEKARSFTDPMNLSYTLLLDEGDQLYGDYNGRSMPFSFLIDETGRIVDQKLGFYLEEDLSERLKTHLGLSVDGEVMVEKDSEETMQKAGVAMVNTGRPQSISKREVLTTDGTKHSVPLDDILSGGPPKDGIPSIDHPKFVDSSVSDGYLDDDGLGIAVSLNGIHRFYPNQVLVWHEIVNDQFGDQAALVTYCPLCGTGIVFEPLVNGKPTEFGTSGKLWNSNLVMYDRQTDSYWSQVLGEGIVGEQTGVQLNRLPYDNITYADFKGLYPDGEVLSRNTGHVRDYQRDPYGDYYTTPGFYFPVDHEDNRYHDKEPTWGIEIDRKTRVYVMEELAKGPEQFEDEFGGIKLKITYDKKLKTIDIRNSATGEEVIPFYGFWFSWISVHPDSEVWTPTL